MEPWCINDYVIDLLSRAPVEEKSSKRVSYKDIAEKAGVSTATVSHVLNGTRYVTPELKQRVLTVVEELGYVPNNVASSLRRRYTNTVGFITTELTNPFYAEIAVAAELVLREHGYMLLISNTFNEIERERVYVKAMLSHQVDGLLFTSVQMESHTWRLLQSMQVPFVLINRRFAGYDAPYVGVDNMGAMQHLVEHLISLGHTRIGFIGGFPHSSSARDRYRGYRRALERHHIAWDPDLLCEGRYDFQSGIEGAERLLTLPPSKRPTAIACANDLMALGVIDWASRNGLEVPRQLSVTGFDDIEVAGIEPISLTTARQPRAEMGRIAAQLLLELIMGHQPQERSVMLPCDIVVRKSTAPPGE